MCTTVLAMSIYYLLHGLPVDLLFGLVTVEEPNTTKRCEEKWAEKMAEA